MSSSKKMSNISLRIKASALAIWRGTIPVILTGVITCFAISIKTSSKISSVVSCICELLLVSGDVLFTNNSQFPISYTSATRSYNFPVPYT